MADIFSKWIKGLEKTSRVTFGRISSVLGATDIDQDTWDDLETILVQADIGVDTTIDIIKKLKQTVYDEGLTKASQLPIFLKAELTKRLKTVSDPFAGAIPGSPFVILMVGVNGSGKTTTTAKLAKQYQDAGKKVMVAAGDTFRAAAIEQLQAWGDRLKIPVIAGVEGGDSAAVAFDAVQSAIARKMDVLIIDTAGRLQSKYNLMEELKKVHRVISKALPGAPHATWIVLDATTGQNALAQAKAFKEAVKVTGVILAKLDTSAKGGMAIAIASELNLPIIYAGLGEKPEDLERFDPESFSAGIIR